MLGLRKYRLSFLVLLGSLFAAPLLVIIYQAILVINSDIQRAQMEERGVRLHAALVEVLEDVGDYGGRVSALRSDVADKIGRVEESKDSLKQAIEDVDKLDRSIGAEMGISARWQDIRTQALSFIEPNVTVLDRRHEELADAISRLLTSVADSSGVTNDPQLDSDLLSNAMVVTPHLFITLSDIARLEAVRLKSDAWWLDDSEREALRGYYSHLLIEDEHLFDYLKRAEEVNLSLPPIAEHHAEKIQPKLDLLTTYITAVLHGGTDGATIAGVGETAADLILAYDKFYDRVSERFLELLIERKSDLIFKESLVLAFSSLAFLGTLALFVILYRNLVRTEQAEQRAASASHIKSEFLANMSHELRTPLNSIIGMSRLLSEAHLPDEQHEMAGGVFRSSVSLLAIVNDILDLSKIESGEMRLERIGFDVMYVLNSVLDTLQQSAREKRLQIVHEHIDPSVPLLLGDPTRLGRIFFNLVGNAIKYSDQGTVLIRTSSWPVDDKRFMFRLEVVDHGIGIAEDKQAIIFDKFVQADTSTTRKYGGTGLGLAICKDLVEMMEGWIGVNSKEGVGSTFWIEIPFEATDRLHEERYLRRERALKGTIPVGQARVLVAEDHPMNQLFIEKLLRRMGIEHVVVVEDGLDVLAAYQHGAWDLVLMDCHMPKMNGYDATQEIRNIEKETGKHVPVVAMTANAMVGDREKCLRFGMDDYISKPVNSDTFRDILGQWLAIPEIAPSRPGEVGTEILDLSAFRSFTGGDVETEKSLIALFIKQSDASIVKLKRYCNVTDATVWSETAHQFKGGAVTIGAKTLGRLCEQAQKFDGADAKRESLLVSIEEEYHRVLQQLVKLGLAE